MSPSWRSRRRRRTWACTVLKPLTEHERYDLAFEVGGRFVRVQCKWADSEEM